MPRFKYNAVSKQGKNLTGIINADTEQGARKKLNTLGLSVIGLAEVPEERESKQTSFNKYRFEASDSEGKRVVGTIAENDLYSAFKRLVKEYELRVEKIGAYSATDAELNVSGDKVSKLYAKYEELENIKASDNTGKEYYEAKEQKELIKTIDEIVNTINKILASYSDEIKPDTKEFLEKYSQHLQKVKFSKNTDNIMASALKVLDYIEKKEMFLADDKNMEDRLKMKLSAMKLSKAVRSQIKSDSTKESLINKVSQLFNTKNKKRLESPLEEFISHFKIFLSTKSKEIRKLTFIKLGTLFKNIFSKKSKNAIQEKQTLSSSIQQQVKPVTQKQFEEKQTQLEKSLSTVTAWLTGIYLLFYFVSLQISQKLPIQSIPPILHIYSTSIMIYVVIGVIFAHTAIRLRSLLLEHKIKYSKISYTLFSILYVMIIINF